VTSDLFLDAGDVGCDFMSGPACSCADLIRRGGVNSGQEGVRLNAAFDRHVRSLFGEINVSIPDSRHSSPVHCRRESVMTPRRFALVTDVSDGDLPQAIDPIAAPTRSMGSEGETGSKK
jgi:hypothetical protein